MDDLLDIILYNKDSECRMQMGRGQVVRQRVLVLLFGGSNPPAPDHLQIKMVFG